MATMRTLRTASGAALAAALLFASAPHATADQVRDDQWALNTLQAKSVWQVTKGKGQVIAVIDSGVDDNHPDLKGSVLKGKDFIDGGSAAPEGKDHGTSMAADIAGHGHGPGHDDGVIGLAPEAKILPIRDDGARVGRYAPSIRYAVDHGATVINISQKHPNAPTGQAMQKAISYALQRNVVIVASTGNEGGSVGYPAALPGVVAVSGVAKDGTFWENSSTGKQTLLSAPAEGIVSAGNSESGYVIGTGTSDATAYTSAAVALLKSKYPDLSAGQIVNRLTKTAVVPGSTKHIGNPDERFGYGAIRPLVALTADIPKGSTWGPLTVPTALKKKAEAEAQKKREQADIAKGQEQADQKAVIIWSVIGAFALVLIVVVVLVIVMVRRKKHRNNGPGGPGGPGAYGGYPYPPTQPQGYGGYPPHQQQPMPPQPSAPPQQPPYN